MKRIKIKISAGDAAQIALLAVCFLLFANAEKTLRVYGLCAGLLFACVYCRRRVVIAALFSVIGGLVNFSVVGLIASCSASLTAIAVYFIHKKAKRKMNLAEAALLAALTVIPNFFLRGMTVNNGVYTLVGALAAALTAYVSIIFLYAATVRGLRYRLSNSEQTAGFYVLAVLSAGAFGINLFGFSIGLIAAAFVSSSVRNLDGKAALSVAAVTGLGGALALRNFDMLAIMVSLGIFNMICGRLNKYLSALLTLAGGAAVCYIIKGFDLYMLAPVALGTAGGVLIPTALINKLKLFRQGYKDKFALRTVVNRDREGVANKLGNLAEAFSDMQKMLAVESRQDKGGSTALIGSIMSGCCRACPKEGVCRENTCDVAPHIGRLVASALDNGKATVLDASSFLGRQCVSLPRLIDVTNDRVRAFRRTAAAKEGVEQGREMMTASFGGVADLLRKMSAGVNNGFSYDTALEERLADELGYRNIVASDVIAYGADTVNEVDVVIREKDLSSSVLDETVSTVVGRRMIRSGGVKEINGMAGVHYSEAPLYTVSYGERSVSKVGLNGDARQAAVLSKDKIMFVLSDGMGTGGEAGRTGGKIVKLVESFYAAGFDHATVLSSAGRLLSLRNSEDFSALDIAIIDTKIGAVDFIKQGGRESYVFRNGECEAVEGGTLPLGIIEGAAPKIRHIDLCRGDEIVMMSDGIADVMTKERMVELFHSASSTNPQYIADAVVKNAMRLSDGRKDDMSCIVLRLSV